MNMGQDDTNTFEGLEYEWSENVIQEIFLIDNINTISGKVDPWEGDNDSVTVDCQLIRKRVK